jgi:UDP-glucose:(heptosyl)LPS alpha-1,3-glucosyltransferase
MIKVKFSRSCRFAAKNLAVSRDACQSSSVTDKTARIAVVMPRLSRYGGAESFAWRFSAALAGRGYDVDFICSRCETEPPEGVRPVVLGRFGPFKWFKVLHFALKADAARKRGGYDLSFGLGKSLGHDIIRVGGGPQRNFWNLSIKAWPPGPQRFLKCLRRRLSPANRIIQWLERKRLESDPLIICVSDLVKGWMCRSFPQLDPERIKVIYNKPDLERFSPATHDERAELRRAAGVAPDEVLVSTAGTNFALKGVRTLVRMMPLLPAHFRLKVAGGRNPEKYVKLAKELGVADRVEFLGKVEDMPSLYRASDIFVLPTFYDACSNAVVEALACGCRVISTTSNGSSIFLPEDMILEDPGDEHGLAQKVLKAAGEPRTDGFRWPDDVECGMEPYIDVVEDMIRKKPRQT